MTDSIDIVDILGGALIQQMAWAGPEVVEAVLTGAATVAYPGDVHAYLADVMPAISAAFTRAMQPRIDAIEADIAASRARIKTLTAQHERFMREFEQFRRMQTPDRLQ